MDDWQVDPQPTLLADPEHFPEQVWGIEDPRITYLTELSKYVIVYTAYSRVGPGVALALTKDFHHFERYGMIMPPEDQVCSFACGLDASVIAAKRSRLTARLALQ